MSAHLQDGNFLSKQRPHVSKKVLFQRPVYFPQDLQLVERCGRTPPGEREVAPYLPLAPQPPTSSRFRQFHSLRVVTLRQSQQSLLTPSLL